MFSSRTNWNGALNPLTQKLHDLRKLGRNIIDLTLSNPTEAGIEYPALQILESLSNPDALLYKPEPRGLLTAREAIAAYYDPKGITVSTNDLVLTASSSESYGFLFSLLCEAQDNVLIPNPSYPLFEFLAQINNIKLRPYQLRYDGEWHIDLDSVRRSIAASTKAIVIVNPHNPTGMFLKEEEWKALNEIAIQNNLALIVDEVFLDYPGLQNVEVAELAKQSAGATALTFRLNGISKMCGLPQLKLGWIAVSGREELKGEALSRLEIIADTFLSVNTPVQLALPQLLKAGRTIRHSIKERIEENLSLLRGLFDSDSPVSLLNSEGGWYAILKIPTTKTEEDWAIRLLEDAGVYVFPGYFFEFQENGYLVISLLPRAKDFARGIQEIVRILKKG